MADAARLRRPGLILLFLSEMRGDTVSAQLLVSARDSPARDSKASQATASCGRQKRWW
jgi:hypothetical protein